MQSRATCKMESAHQGHVNTSCAQEFHHRRDLQGAGQGSRTSVANLISLEVERGHCAIILVILHFVKPARKSRHHCPFGCFSSAVARVFRSRTMLPFLQGVGRRSTRRQVCMCATRAHSLCALACGFSRWCAKQEGGARTQAATHIWHEWHAKVFFSERCTRLLTGRNAFVGGLPHRRIRALKQRGPYEVSR